MQSILILSFSALDRDPRVNRQIALLTKNYHVTSAGYTDSKIAGQQYVNIKKNRNSLLRKILNLLLLKTRRFRSYYWALDNVKTTYNKLKINKYDLIIANDLDTLPLALKLSRKDTKVFFDAHEYFPRQYEDQREWRYLYQPYIEWMCEKYIGQANEMTTVCDGIAEEYLKNYKIKPVVVTNAPPFLDLKPRFTTSDEIRMIHHGAAHPSRKLDLMIKTMELLGDRFFLDLLLVGDSGYISTLKNIAKENKRIRFLAPVEMTEISNVCNQYDVGFYLLPPTNFNNSMALPNKIFEFIQARLAVAIGPSTEMKRIVERYDCGVVASDFSPVSLAKVINELSREKINYYKKQSDIAARELNFEENSKIILNLVKKLVSE